MLHQPSSEGTKHILEKAFYIVSHIWRPPAAVCYPRKAKFAGHAIRAKGEIISDILLWKASTGRKLTFPDTISRDTGIKVEDLFGAKLRVKSRPRPQDDERLPQISHHSPCTRSVQKGVAILATLTLNYGTKMTSNQNFFLPFI